MLLDRQILVEQATEHVTKQLNHAMLSYRVTFRYGARLPEGTMLPNGVMLPDEAMLPDQAFLVFARLNHVAEPKKVLGLYWCWIGLCCFITQICC